MVYNLRIGIRNRNSKREKVVLEIFNSIKQIIKEKKEDLFDLQIEDYDALKREFEKEDIDVFERTNQKAITEFEKEIILFNDSFFDCIEINKKSIFIHEIGHIVNKPPNSSNFLVKYIYAEFLADKYLFEIDKDIFLNGRIIPDLDIISIIKIRNEIEGSNNDENIINWRFVVVGRLYYYYSFCKYEPILSKINELIGLIKEYFSDIDFILTDLRKVCNELQFKKYQELGDSFRDIDDKIKKNVKRF